MVSHQCKCSKEIEITEMRDDIKYIRKALEGNGHKGLVSKVDEHEEFKNKWLGGVAIVGILGAFIGSLIIWAINKFM